MLALWEGSDLQLPPPQPREGYVDGARGSVYMYMLGSWVLHAGQVHTGPGGVLWQVDRSVCAQMQGRDGICCIAAWEPDVCACRSCWVCVCTAVRLTWLRGGGTLC